MGQSGVASASQSKSQTGKFESIPPSTRMCSRPSRSFTIRTGSKKIGIDMLARTASATSSSSGLIPSTPASRGRISSRRAVMSETITCSLYCQRVSVSSVFSCAKVRTPFSASMSRIHSRKRSPS